MISIICAVSGVPAGDEDTRVTVQGGYQQQQQQLQAGHAGASVDVDAGTEDEQMIV